MRPFDHGITSIPNYNPEFFHVPSSIPLRSVIAVWLLLVISLAFMGNTFVLVSSLRSKSIKLDRISVTIIQNIAITDICFSAHMGVSLVSVFADSWPFGELICMISNYWSIYFGIMELTLICALNISKLTILISPLQARCRRKSTAVLICGAIWVIPLANILPSIALGRLVEFRRSFFRCEGYFTGRFYKLLPMVNMLVFMVFPMLIVAVGMGVLIYIVRRIEGIRRQGMVTLISISACYFLSFLPFGLYYVLRGPLGFSDNYFVGVYYYRVALFCTNCSFAANPIIYFLSLRSFRDYTVNQIAEVRHWTISKFRGAVIVISSSVFESFSA